jgi:putative phage-type endonuclease
MNNKVMNAGKGVYERHNLKGVGRSDWLEMRREAIGGSDAAVILGLNPFGSELKLWSQKKGRAYVDEKQTEPQKLGSELEDYVARRFAAEQEKTVERAFSIFGNKNYPWALANIDRRVKGENAGLECKTISSFNQYDFESGEIPPYYYCQCIHYMAVCGFDKMYLAVLELSKGFHVFEIERDEREINALMDAERDWWTRYIEGNEVPDPDGSKASELVIKHLIPGADETKRTMLYGYEGEMAKYCQLANEIKELKQQQDMIKQELQLQLGDATEGTAEGYKVTWKSQTSSRIDSKKLKEEFPTVYQSVLKESHERIFRLKATK